MYLLLYSKLEKKIYKKFILIFGVILFEKGLLIVYINGEDYICMVKMFVFVFLR